MLAASALAATLLAAAPLDPAGCPSCHREVAKQWSASAHARSGSDPIYRANFAIEPMRWCESCHAPAADRSIGCVACHLKEGAILSAKPPTPAALRAHPIRFVAGALAASCTACHQFNFPTDRARGEVKLSNHPMQNTVEEAKGDARPCQSCHDHAMRAAFDLPTLRSAISVSVKRAGAELRVELASRDVPHRVPTGDPFHRLRFELCADAGCAHVTASRELGREVVTATAGWFIGHDDTLSPGTPTVLEFPSPTGTRWRLLYLYAARSVEPSLTPAQRQLEVYGGPLP
jgi:hypothetical protein